MATAIRQGFTNMSNGGLLRFPPAPSFDDREDRNGLEGPEKHRRRPLSADLGHKARDAVMDLGRAARGLYQLRSPARESDTFQTVTRSKHDLDNLIPVTSGKPHDETVGLGLDEVARVPKLTYNDYSQGEEGRNGRGIRRTADAPMPLQADESLFAGPSRASRTTEKEQFHIDRVEITLEDVESDSPLFRAALQNMEKRTIAVKRASKGLCKAASDRTTALTALEATESQLTANFSSVSSLMATTFGAIHEHVVAGIYESEQARRDLARKALEEHITRPMMALYEMCKALLAQFKTFDAESRSYYAATQKWLSSMAPTSNQCLDERNYSAEAIGYDRSNPKQERLDERQHLRRLTFDLSRLKLYQSMCHLHAGESELLVSAHALIWCRSQNLELSSMRYVDTLATEIHAEVRASQERMRDVHLRCQQAQAQVTEFQSSLQQDLADHQSELKLGDDLNGVFITQRVASLEQSVQFTRSNPQTDVLEPAASLSPQCTSEEKTASRDDQHPEEFTVTQEFGVLPSMSGAPSSAKKWQARLRTLSFTKQPPQEHLDNAVSPNPRVSEGRNSKPDRVRSPQRRSFSFTSGNGPPAVKRQTDDRTGGDGAHARGPLSPKPAVPGDPPTRKREGILWVMSKPVQGLSGGDVPRAATRAYNWRECWVVLSGSGHLSEYVNWKEAGRCDSVKPMIDLRFATVREARGVERRFTFEVVTREQRRFFQASNEEEMRIWVAAISLAIESLINGTSSIRQVEKVVRHVEMSPGLVDRRSGVLSHRDFGVRRIFDGTSGQHESTAVGVRAAFSQSLTDLSTATTAKLFSRAGRDSGARGRRNGGKHESNTFDHVAQGMHLAALSEGEKGPDHCEGIGLHRDRSGRMTSSGEDDTTVDEECVYAPQTRSTHSRGISNSTPLSGYIGRNGDHNHGLSKDWSASQTASKSNLDICTAFDRKIELMVNSSYGPASPFNSSCHTSSGFHSRNEGTSCSSASLSRLASQIGESVVEERMPTYKHCPEGSNRYSRTQEILTLASEDENRFCADCRAPNPRWASWCLNGDKVCIFICITCSGVHRSLGVHVSKVRSVDLDEWTDEQLGAARTWGNLRANAMYERRKPVVCTVESMGGTRTKAFWAAKYVDRLWCEVEGSPHHGLDQEKAQRAGRKERPYSYAGSCQPPPHELTSAPLASSRMSNRMSTPCMVTTSF